MIQKLSESELVTVRARLHALHDEIVKAGLRSSLGITTSTKMALYARKRIGIEDLNLVSAAGWEKFFRQVDGLRFDMVGLARYINTLVPQPVQNVLPFQPVSADFSAADIAMLRKAWISPCEDGRVPMQYWKDRV